MKGAEYTNIAIHKGASKLREHISPEDTPTQVSPSVAKSLQVAKQATGGAVRVSQFLGEDLLSFSLGTREISGAHVSFALQIGPELLMLLI